MDNLPAQNEKMNFSAKKFFGPKVIFVILAVILLLEVIYAIRTLTLPIPTPSPIRRIITQKTVGRISLNAPQDTFNTKDIVPVSVLVDTGGYELGGVDLIVHYDPKILEAISGGLIKGTIFDEYPLLSVEPNKGLISISGISGLKGFKGTGQFATLNLKAKSAGKTSLTIDFKKGSTTASNLVEINTSKNILEQVDSLNLKVQ